jgi:hypothetical protein
VVHLRNGLNEGRNIIRSLNSILWDESLRKIKKKRISRTIVQSVMTYGAEAWDVNRKNRNKLLSTEMVYLQRGCRRTRLERIRNETIREMMKVEKDITDEARKRQLMWFGHANRMGMTGEM